jgi:hypothetical protein
LVERDQRLDLFAGCDAVRQDIALEPPQVPEAQSPVGENLAALVQSIRQQGALCPAIIIAADREEADRRLAEIEASGHVLGRDPLLILTGVPRELRRDHSAAAARELLSARLGT